QRCLWARAGNRGLGGRLERPRHHLALTEAGRTLRSALGPEFDTRPVRRRLRGAGGPTIHLCHRVRANTCRRSAESNGDRLRAVLRGGAGGAPPLSNAEPGSDHLGSLRRRRLRPTTRRRAWPPKGYARAELQDYLAHSRQKCKATIEELTDENA